MENLTEETKNTLEILREISKIMISEKKRLEKNFFNTLQGAAKVADAYKNFFGEKHGGHYGHLLDAVATLNAKRIYNGEEVLI